MKKTFHNDAGLEITVAFGSVRATFVPELRYEIDMGTRSPAFLIQRSWDMDTVIFVEPEDLQAVRFPTTFHEAERLLYREATDGTAVRRWYSRREKCISTFLETH